MTKCIWYISKYVATPTSYNSGGRGYFLMKEIAKLGYTSIIITSDSNQFIKAAVVSRAFSKHPNIQEIIVHTGQHFDLNMSEIFFEEMNIPKPYYNLQINSLSHGAMTGLMIKKIEEILIKENPDWVLLYGDTNSTIAGSIAAKKLKIKIAHVEAGLRTFDMKNPEEINRVITDRLSDILFVRVW